METTVEHTPLAQHHVFGYDSLKPRMALVVFQCMSVCVWCEYSLLRSMKSSVG